MYTIEIKLTMKYMFNIKIDHEGGFAQTTSVSEKKNIRKPFLVPQKGGTISKTII